MIRPLWSPPKKTRREEGEVHLGLKSPRLKLCIIGKRAEEYENSTHYLVLYYSRDSLYTRSRLRSLAKGVTVSQAPVPPYISLGLTTVCFIQWRQLHSGRPLVKTLVIYIYICKQKQKTTHFHIFLSCLHSWEYYKYIGCWVAERLTWLVFANSAFDSLLLLSTCFSVTTQYSAAFATIL